MPNAIGKHLNLCLANLQRPSPSSPRHDPTSSHAGPSSPSSPSTVVFSSFSAPHGATSSDPKSSPTDSSTVDGSTTAITATGSDISTAIASRRLLLSSPGRSNSIVDSAAIDVVGIGVAVPTYSDHPYAEFRRSMEEMAEAMATSTTDPTERSERLCDLLLCYLVLNRKHAHKHIVWAFTDLLAELGISVGESSSPCFSATNID